MLEPEQEQEQLQLIKAWGSKYGYLIILLVSLLLGVGIGWKVWWNYSNNYRERAANLYLQLLNSQEYGQLEEVKSQARKLVETYPSSSYASLAALSLAKYAVTEGSFAEAVKLLEPVVAKSPASSLRQLARIRMARILIEETKYEEALKLLRVVDDRYYLAEIYETRADALMQLGNSEEAERLYRQAAKLDGLDKLHSPLLLEKLRQF